MYYFASDTHLGGGEAAAARAVERRFVAWLEEVSVDAEAIFLLGDIFDFWFEYHEVVPKGCVRTLGKLAELTDRGIRVVLLTGNHDMWIGDYLQRECGVECYTKPLEVTLAGKHLYLAHGDNMQIDDQPMLKFLNRVFRSRTLRWLFSWCIHPDWAVRFGRAWSGSSRKRHAAEGTTTAAMTEPLVEYARAYNNKGIDYFIFGHMHFQREVLENQLHTVHLGCWEQQGSYAALDADGRLTVKTFDR